MEEQLHRHHHCEDDTQDIAGLHDSVTGSESGGDNKSVLKKVKDKAKKIKDTIRKHGVEHDYRHDQISEEEEDYDKHTLNMSEVHGSPMCGSPVIPGTALPIQTDVVNLEKPTHMQEDRYEPIGRDVYPNIVDEGIIRPSGPGKMENELERSPVAARGPEFEDLPRSNPDLGLMGKTNLAEPAIRVGPLIGGLEEDPHSPKNHPRTIPPSNYQSKVADPTGEGGREAEVGSLLERLDNFHIQDQSTPTTDQLAPDTNPVNRPENPPTPKSFGPIKPEYMESMPRDTIAGKIYSATSAMADKAVSAKDMVVSKLGYGGEPQKRVVHSDREPETVGSSEMSGGWVRGEAGRSDTPANVGGRGVSVKEYLTDKLKPGEEDKALSEAIAERFYRKKKEERGVEEVQTVRRVVGPEEMAAGLGAAKEVKDCARPGDRVVDRVKGAVGSWFSKGSGAGSVDH